MTKELLERYIKVGGLCPYCESTLEVEQVWHEDGDIATVYQLACSNCPATFRVLHEVTNIFEVTGPC